MLEIRRRTSCVDATLDGQIPNITSLEDVGVPLKPETEAEAFKRMIQERNRDEEELEEAVPTASAPSGVSSVINSRANSRAASRAASRANSMTSGATTPRRDLFSGVTSMKEMFDISYAVHRMTEEKQRRKSIRSIHDPDANRHSVFMHEINGDTSSEEDLVLDETSSSSQTDEDVAETLAALQAKKHHHKKHGTKSNKGGLFELKMENATLLGRRKVPSATQPIDDQPVFHSAGGYRKVPSATQPIDDIPVHYTRKANQPIENMFEQKVSLQSQQMDYNTPVPQQTGYTQVHPLDPQIRKTTTQQQQPVNNNNNNRKFRSATQPIDD